MSHKKGNDVMRTERQLDKLQWETAEQLSISNKTTTELREMPAGVATDMEISKELVKKGEHALRKEGRRKAELNPDDRDSK